MTLLSVDPGRHTGWAILNDKCELLNYGKIEYKSMTDYQCELELVLIKYKPDETLIEEPTFLKFGLNTYGTLRDIFAYVKFVCSGYSIVNTIKIHELRRLYKGSKRGVKKQMAKRYVKSRFGLDFKDDNICDAIVNGEYWLKNKDLIMRQRKALAERKKIKRQLRRLKNVKQT